MNDTKQKYLKWPHLVVFVLVASALVAVFHQPLYGQLYAWSLIPKPEPYTELYFTDNTATLPAEQQRAISFSIHNVEYQTSNYAYTIEQLNTDDSVVARLAEDHISLHQDDKKDVSLPINPILTDKPAKVRVTITFLEKDKRVPTSQSIYYLTKPRGI